jgi:hypothetical protein
MRRTRPLGLLVVCGLAAACINSEAKAGPRSLSELLLGARHHNQQIAQPSPPVAIYAPDSGEAFIFDRAASPPLMRFESSQEIWVLQPEPGPRGDTIYKNDLGEPMLRATRLGGLTLFTMESPGGTAVALQGEAPPIRPPAILSPAALLQHLAQASARTSHALQRLVVFDAPDVTPESAYLVADAAGVTAEAIAALDKKTREGLKLNRVVFEPGRAPAAKLVDGVLQITVAPTRGVAGRPSSRRLDVVMRR